MAGFLVLPIHAMVSFTGVHEQKDFDRKGREENRRVGKADRWLFFASFEFPLRTLRLNAFLRDQARFRTAFFATARLRGLATNSAGSTFFADFHSRSRS